MAVRPELVDFGQVKEDESNLIGIAGRHPVRESSEAFGNEILEYTMKTLIAGIEKEYKTIKEMEDYKQTLYNDELLNILPDGVIIFDTNGEVIQLNQQAFAELHVHPSVNDMLPFPTNRLFKLLNKKEDILSTILEKIRQGIKDVSKMAENNLGNTQYFRTKPDADLEVKEVLDLVYNAMDEKGYNPVNQIVGYIMSGDPTYVTSFNGARSLIMKVERDELVEELLKAYIEHHSWE